MQPVLCMSHCHFCSYTFRWENDILFVCYFIRFKSSSIWLQTVSIDLIVLNIDISYRYIWSVFCFALHCDSLIGSQWILVSFFVSLFLSFVTNYFGMISFWMNQIQIFIQRKLPNDPNKMFEKLLCYEIKKCPFRFQANNCLAMNQSNKNIFPTELWIFRDRLQN